MLIYTNNKPSKMLWPLLTPSELEIAGLANGDSLVQVALIPENVKVPFAVISKTSIHIFNQKPVSTLGAHVRSKESLQTYGYNESVGNSKNGELLAVKTSKNFLLIYSIYGPWMNKSAKYEVLHVYNESDHLVQDVYPVDKNMSFFSFSAFSKNDNVDDDNVDVGDDTEANENEQDDNAKLHDGGLRLRLTLKISNELIGYHFLPSGHLCVLTNKKKSVVVDNEEEENSVAIQILSIKDAHEGVKSYFIDDFAWFNELGFVNVIQFEYHEEWNLFSFITNNGNCWVFRSNGENTVDLDQTDGFCLYSKCNAVKVILDYAFKLILIITADNDILFYNLQSFPSKNLQLLKQFNKPLNSKDIVNLKFCRNERFMVVLYSNGWCLLSIFGNINFSTFDYDDNLGITQTPTSHPDNWFTNVKDVDFYSNDSNLLFLHDYGIYMFSLLRWNALDVQSDGNTKRPILYHDSLIYIFKSIDYVNMLGGNGSSMDDRTSQVYDNKELATCWNILDVPSRRFVHIDPIRYLSISNNGLNLVLYGMQNLVLYTFSHNKWKTFTDIDLDVNCNIVWWKNEYFFLDNYNPETKKHELLMFNIGKIANNISLEFSSNCIIWKYEFNSRLKYINLDESLNELLIVTQDSFLFTFKLSQVLKVDRKQVFINLHVKLSLNMDISGKLGNFSLIKVNDVSNNLLVLNNGDLFYLNLAENSNKCETLLMYTNIEFINKIGNSFYFFNGDDILYLNTIPSNYTKSDSLIPLKISNFDDQFYPLILNSSKDFYIIGLTVDIITSRNCKILKLLNNKKYFLHDLLNFELNNLLENSSINEKLQDIYKTYKDSCNINYSLELLLYMVTTKSDADSKLKLLLQLILKFDSYLNIIAKCLRKIEIQYWDRIFSQLQQTPKDLLHQCINMKDYQTAGYYLIICLSHQANSKIVEKDEITMDDRNEILLFLKIIVDNLNNPIYNKNNQLWDMGIELIRFLKVLDTSGSVLQEAIKFLN